MGSLALIIIVVYFLIFTKLIISRDGFAVDNITKAKEIMASRELFSPGNASYSEARTKIKWLDPVVYYDAVRLANSNKLTSAKVASII